MPRIFDFDTAPYKVKYREISAKLIYNQLELSLSQQLKLEEKKKFFSSLEKSVLEEGFRNPISICVGKRIFDLTRRVPDQKDLFHFKKQIVLPKAVPYVRDEHLFYCCMNGGSRLMIAQKHNFKIPCIIADFWDYVKEPAITNFVDLSLKYKDVPESLELREWGIFVKGLPHTHLN